MNDIILPEVPQYIRQYGRDDGDWKRCRENVLKFSDKFCDRVELTGGKGSSLAVLTQISRNNEGVGILI